MREAPDLWVGHVAAGINLAAEATIEKRLAWVDILLPCAECVCFVFFVGLCDISNRGTELA